MSVLVCSVRWSVSESRSNRVATRPWLAFQANAMVKIVSLHILVKAEHFYWLEIWMYEQTKGAERP